ncbi:GNAT family N-acetyltransferase [Streptomyces sp. NBC_00191]|uniref:GNAT family N-acetyltransferase n=1 Tax=Streptomyces sp. NBC_00191 TaxID=2975674 RepID=UPI003245D830
MLFDVQPWLKGELVELRPLRAEDYADLYAVAADPLVWEQHPDPERYRERAFSGFFRDALESGSSRYHGYDDERDEVEIGWSFLARSHWGGVYNRELKELMLNHAFRFVSSVIFLVGPDNVRSQRAVEKIGGVRAGSRLDGSGQQSLLYRIYRTEASTRP